MKYNRKDVDFGALNPSNDPMWKLCLEIESSPDIPEKNKYLAIGVLRSMLYLKYNKEYVAELAYLKSTNQQAYLEARNTDPYLFSQDMHAAKDVIRAQPYTELQTKAGIVSAHLAFHINGYAGTASINESVVKVQDNISEVEEVAKGLLNLNLNKAEHIKNFAMKIKDSPTGCTAERLMDAQVYGATVIFSQGEKPKIPFAKLTTEGDIGGKLMGESQEEALLAYLQLFAAKEGELVSFENGTVIEIKPENYKAFINAAAKEIPETFYVDSTIPENFSDDIWNQLMEKMLSKAEVTPNETNPSFYNVHFADAEEARLYQNYLKASGINGMAFSKLTTDATGAKFTLSQMQLVTVNSLIAQKPQQAEVAKENVNPVPAKPILTSRNKMAQRLKNAVDSSATPQRYQALANMIHYDGKKDLSHLRITEDDGNVSSVIDNPKYYGSAFFSMVPIFGENIPDTLKAVNSIENIEPLIAWAEDQAKEKSLARVKDKFNITDPQILQRLEKNLDTIYKEYHEPEKIKEATVDLKNMLIHARLEKKYPTQYAKNKQNIERILNEFSAKEPTPQAVAQAKMALKAYFPHATPAKVEAMLTKFAILRRIENPQQLAKKIENEVIGVMHDRFAQEIELLNNVQRVELKGDETLYRGISLGAFTEEKINQLFNDVHRAIGKSRPLTEEIGTAAGFGAHQIKTQWNHIHHPDFQGSIASDATATTLDPKIAFDYALGKRSGATSEGWVFEIRPKAGDTAVSLANYEGRGDKYAELDLTQVDPKEIKAVHKIRRNPDGSVDIIQTMENPNYKKRPNDEIDPGLLKAGVKVESQGYVEGTPSRTLRISSGNSPAATSWNVINSPGYQNHISGKQVKQKTIDSVPTPQQIRSNRDSNKKQYEHLKPEVLNQVSVIYKHFGDNYSVDYSKGLSFYFPLSSMNEHNRKAFETLLKNARIQPEADEYNMYVSIKPEQYQQVITVLKQFEVQLQKSKEVLEQKINEATTVADIINAIRAHDGEMLSRGGMFLNKQAQIKAIENVLNPNPNYIGDKVTSNYELERKVHVLAQQERAAKNTPAANSPHVVRPLPQISPQASPQIQPQVVEGLAAKSISALNSWFMTRNIQQQEADQHLVVKVLSELRAIQQRQMLPAQERSAVLMCLSTNAPHIKFNILKALNLDERGVPIPEKPLAQAAPQSPVVPQPQAAPQVEDPVKLSIKEIDNTMFWAIIRNDERHKWTVPLRQELEVLDKSNKSPAEKRQQLYLLVAEMYASAKNSPTGFNAARIAEDILKDVLKVAVPVVPVKPVQPQMPQVQSPKPVQPQFPQVQSPKPVQPQTPQLQVPKPVQPQTPQVQTPIPQPQTPLVHVRLPVQPIVRPPEEIQREFAEMKKAAELISLFSVSKDDLMNRYLVLRKGHGVKDWFKARAKGVGTALGDKGRLREQQINELAKAFDIISNDNTTTREKGLDMYAYLSKLTIDVAVENSTFIKISPAIIELCQQYMKQIENIVGKENIQALNNSPDLKTRADNVASKVADAIKPEHPQVGNDKKIK